MTINNSEKEIELLDIFEEEKIEVPQKEIKKDNSKLKYPKYDSFEKKLMRKIIPIVVMIIVSAISLFKIFDYIANNKETFKELSTSNYFVCLSDNEYYELECQPENMQYLAGETKTIKYNVSYNALYNYNVDKKYNYDIVADLDIYSDEENSKTLIHKSEKLVSNKMVKMQGSYHTINDTVTIPFSKYYNLIQSYENKYGVLTKSTFKITFKVNNKDISSINMNLGRSTYKIDKQDTKNSSIIDKSLKESLTSELMVYIIVFAVSSIVSIILLINIIYFLIRYTPKKSSYQNSLKEILKNYDRIIVEIKDVKPLIQDKPIIKVKTFLELVDLRDTIDRPILHVRINSIKDAFYVNDADKIYEYVMKDNN